MSSSPRARPDVGSEAIDPIDPTREATTSVSFAHAVEGDAIEVVDPIDRYRYTLGMDADASPTPTDTDEFLFPVDAAVDLTTATITLPTALAVCVRDQRGIPLLKTEHHATHELPEGAYSIELLAPIRLYLRVEGSIRVVSDADRTRIEFGEPTTIGIGARSHHERPAGTITVTDDPEDMMAAVSTFGSALATTSPERSYPSFRGHPPLIERGEELDVPEGLAPPETGLRIEVPAEYRAVYVVAPLAYYLGARVVPGEVPRLVADDGFEYPLDAESERGADGGDDAVLGDGFETAVARVLKQTFVLDCATRTEGVYPVALHERRGLEDVLELDFAALYDRPLAERVEAYLEVPFEAVKSHLPEWKLTTHVAPTAESVESLPFAVNDLAVVRTPRARELSVSAERAATIERQREAVDDFMRSARGGTTAPDPGNYVDPAATDSLEAVWVGDGRPLNGGKATAAAYHNRLDREPAEGNIHVTVVCNDINHTGNGPTGMADEHAAVEEAYGGKLSLPFEVTVHHDLTTDELDEVLATDTDFFHYIGHIDERGFECTDGIFDANDLDAVGADAFFLNACRSYDQGMAMLDAGAIGGIVTYVDVVNGGAVPIGKAIIRLLNAGFPLGAALEVARSEAVAGERYLVVGDQGLAITQTEGPVPNLCILERSEDSFQVEYKTYTTPQVGMGGIVIPYFEQNHEYFLISGSVSSFDISREELQDFLSLENAPVRVNGDLRWSKYVSVDEI